MPGDREEIAHAQTQDMTDEVRLLSPASVAGDTDRYVDSEEEVLGHGGMGIVTLVRDRRINRRVAKKSLRTVVADQSEVRARFLREAQVQGQLEHPAVVPVYDVSHDEDVPYFTMKSVRGVTLEDILRRLKDGDPEAGAQYNRHRLLSAFSTVCLAIHYAHERGVLHRDLKPANIMLGDYGEVYVLDWGIARIRSAADVAAAEPLELDHLHDAMTQVGTVLGTPGYVAPEQLRKDAGEPDRRCDVYALGAILFELLTFDKLHPPETMREMIESTVRGVDARPSVRAPEVTFPPELDVVCQRATATDPVDRYADARALHDAVQRVMAGERDLQLRRDKARDHAQRARAAAERIRADPTGGIEARRVAMRELGKSLALDPDNAAALATVVQLLKTTPEELPPEVAYEIDKSYRRRTRWVARIGAGTYMTIFGFLPLLWWMGIRQPLVVGAAFALMLVASGLSVKAMRSKRPSNTLVLSALLSSTLAFVFIGRIFGTMIVVPAAIAVNATGYSIFLDRRWRPLVVLVSVAAMLVPLGLEYAGALTSAYELVGGRFTVAPLAVEFSNPATMTALVLANVAAVVIGAVVVGHIRDRLDEAEHRLYMYAWHVRELVPPPARPETDPTAQ